MVASARAESAAGSARRLNQPRAVLVEAHVDGSPRTVNRAPVALVREEWRVVDRWWTEEPVNRRYFDVVLAGGEHAVVFRDEEVGRWFSQRGS
jgi:Tfp pilus assembly protein FimV